MHQLKLGTIPLPKTYVCENNKEAQKARQLGLSYFVRPKGWDDDKLAKMVLWPLLVRKFPYIDWEKVFGFSQAKIGIKVAVSSEERNNPGFDTGGWTSADMEVSEDKRYTDGGCEEDPQFYQTQDIESYLGGNIAVDIQELQQLKMLPEFLDDITNAIKVNTLNTVWMDGYNKKLGCNLGTYQGTSQADNLMILDVSGSIPGAVAFTMLSLIETLRCQAKADLIITSGKSAYWKANESLPSPEELTSLVGGCNERVQFDNILREHVLGKHWGNIICFGDEDAPSDRRLSVPGHKDITDQELQSTRIDRILGFHTYKRDIPGYALWAKKAAPNAEIILNNKWVRSMKMPAWFTHHYL